MNATKFLENYEKLRTVGKGAFGTATLYKRRTDGLHVVIKEIFTMDMDNVEKKAALNEVEILATLDHPNIIKYIGSFQKTDSLLIVMEYADGGNLAQLINSKKNKNEIFQERSILNITSQITSAMAYMHSRKILHRDLKTANIFLTMTRSVKVGDFGISKALNTKSQAHTVVGTPYYLSPEMCEGSDYNEKSDIWAIGCIVYELTSLKKPFEAPTLPVLVQKIMICEYEEIPEMYSNEIWVLVKSILQRDANLRPTAKFINESVIPKIMTKLRESHSATWSTIGPEKTIDRSILYKFTDLGVEKDLVPIELPHKKIIDFGVSSTHTIAITKDKTIYVWGENNYGQLGVSDTQYRDVPMRAGNLREQKIKNCAIGNGFSIFLNEQGFLLSCGDGKQGCLGHGNWDTLTTPIVLRSITNNVIVKISCGNYHVVALSSEGKVFTWGSSKNGQLGQGHTQHRCKPLAILLQGMFKIKNIFCGVDTTVLLGFNGQVLVSGNNDYGKLGFSDQQQINLFKPLQEIKEKISFVALGVNHTMMLTENGTLIGFGRNLEGQLGKGTVINYNQPQIVRLKYKIMAVTCGMNFTVAVDKRNVLWFWGSSRKTITRTSHSVDNQSMTSLGKNLIETNLSSESIEEYIKVPHILLAFYSSEKNVKNGNLIYLGDIKSCSSDLFILAHTTTPPPVKQFMDTHHGSFTIGEYKTNMAPSFIINLPNTTR